MHLKNPLTHGTLFSSPKTNKNTPPLYHPRKKCRQIFFVHTDFLANAIPNSYPTYINMKNLPEKILGL